jgi:hypothetical protein
MKEFIRVVNGTHPGAILNLLRKWSLQMKEWLQANGVKYEVMQGGAHPKQEWLDIQLSPKEMEGIIDRWFKSLGITPKKNNHDGKEDPFDIWWEFP